MAILVWIIFGGLVGWVSSMLVGTSGEQGFVLNVVVGVVGAVLGGYIMNYFGEGGVTGFNFYSFMVALGGAVVLLTVLRLIR
jgi:uncharacterized membrane protein YeaQ/YmgE (transglycosylase-associated protein family)